jgi:hypothetical protein
MLDKEIKDLLPDIIKNTMDALTENTNATDEITIPVVLAVASFATQGLADGSPEMWEKCAISNYFCVLVPSGGLKTSISDSVLEGARRFELEQRETAEDAETQYQIDMKKYEAEIKNKAKEKYSPLVIPGMNAPITPFTRIEKPKYPRTARYMAGKFTLNGIINALKGVPHFGIFNSDAAEFFNSHAFKDPTSSIELVSALSRLWSGEQIDKLTGLDDIVTSGKRTTALFMLQQQLAGFFVNSQFKDQGFTNRMLITQSEKISKKQADFTSAGRSKQKTTVNNLIPFNDRVYELLASVDNRQQKPSGKGLFAMRKSLLQQQNNDKNTLILDTHPWCTTDSTSHILQDFYNDMLGKMDQKKYVEYHNFISRAYEHCIRLATVISLFDKKQHVDERDAGCSVGLMYYFIDQRMNLTIDGSVKTNDIVECSKKVHDFLVRKHSNTEITKTVLNNSGPYQYREMGLNDRDKVLLELESRDIIKITQDGQKFVVCLLNNVC